MNTGSGWAGFDDESWSKYRNYADQVTVSVRFVEWMADENPSEVWFFSIPGDDSNRDWLVRQVKGLSLSRTDEGLVHEPSILEVHETHVDWGAEGGSQQIILFLTQAVVAGATWELFKSLGQRVIERMRRSRVFPPLERLLSEDEVIARSKWTIAESYSVDENRLELISVETGCDAATVELQGPGDTSYTCSFEVLDNALVVARLKRQVAR